MPITSLGANTPEQLICLQGKSVDGASPRDYCGILEVARLAPDPLNEL